MSMTLIPNPTAEQQLSSFFRASVGQWRSERRYYTLPVGETQEVISHLTIQFLPAGSPELLELAQLHNLADVTSLVCGALVTWDSQYSLTGKQGSIGQTIFGAQGNVLYRDRGFATSKPVTAIYQLPNPDTLCLRTEYQKSVFEEEIKLVGTNYRTRQTIISRAGEQQMIGQYLEKRIE
jgi:CpeS-like protein